MSYALREVDIFMPKKKHTHKKTKLFLREPGKNG